MSAPQPCIHELRRSARMRLAASGHSSAALEADLLLSAVTGLARSQLIARSDARLSRLLPRPETETLVEQALDSLPASAALRVADLGTGSGAIAAALAHERPEWSLIGIERDAEALAVAALNVEQLRLNNLDLVHGDWSSALATASVDAILSNPPYVRHDDRHLTQGDLRFEPAAALVSGEDGLDAIRCIIADAPRCLRPGGLLAIEHGWDQGPSLRGLMQARGLKSIETLSDLAGRERVTRARYAHQNNQHLDQRPMT
ncbi:peptide chain release factor N(5)-glutamine methyltransferase [Halochromatium sp.]